MHDQKLNPTIHILLPTFNNRDDFVRTIGSIKTQTYPPEYVYTTIVDFGSTDGTYEEALKLSFHTGVYQFPVLRRGHSMAAMANVIWQEVCPPNVYAFNVLLNPGDIIYPNFISRCVSLMLKYSKYNPAMLICEVDISLESGQIKKSTPIYLDTMIIDGKKQLSNYLDRGITHNIYCFGGTIWSKKHRTYRDTNERIWWSKMLQAGIDRNVLYTPDSLACINEKFYEDEIEEILLRWEKTICQCRQYESFYEKSLDVKALGDRNVSFYALWRAFLLYKKGEYEVAENCALLAKIINPEIVQQKEYRLYENYMSDNSLIEHLEELWNLF